MKLEDMEPMYAAPLFVVGTGLVIAAIVFVAWMGTAAVGPRACQEACYPEQSAVIYDTCHCRDGWIRHDAVLECE